ncbi:zinc-dependent metalloprotease [Pedobacter sp. UC225_65]|uniref:zinc-dependent metalloprotease n=1 Tax=Pedobacter sp. UC225_65 TaxID=3350173 RepID=UPI0036711715
MIQRDQSEDLGDNAMKASTYGIANLKRILPNIEKWTFQKGKDYSDLGELYGEVIGQFSRYMGHVTYNIGGLSENYKTYDQAGAVYNYVSKAKQKEAITFLNQQLFTTPLWLINSDQLNKFDNGSMLTRIKSVQTSTIGNILSSSRLLRLLDNETKNGASAYTMPELFTDLRGTIFAIGRPDAFKRNLQRGYIDRLGSLMVDAPLPQGLPPGFSFTPVNVGVTDIRPFVRAELKTLLATAKARAIAGDATTKAHYEDLAVRINDILVPKK